MRCQGKLTEMFSFERPRCTTGIPGRSYVPEGYMYVLKTYITSVDMESQGKVLIRGDRFSQTRIFDKAIEELQSGG